MVLGLSPGVAQHTAVAGAGRVRGAGPAVHPRRGTRHHRTGPSRRLASRHSWLLGVGPGSRLDAHDAFYDLPPGMGLVRPHLPREPRHPRGPGLLVSITVRRAG